MNVALHSFVLVVAGVFASSAKAATVDPRFNAFMGQVMGNSTTVSFGGGGQPLVTSSAGLGTPTLGNMALAPDGKNVRLSGNVQVPLGDSGRRAAALARVPIKGAAFARGVGAVVGGPGGLALLALPKLIDWIDSTGNFRVHAELGTIEKRNETSGTEYQICQVVQGSRTCTSWGSKASACSAYAGILSGSNPSFRYDVASSASGCMLKRIRLSDGSHIDNVTVGYDSRPGNGIEWLPSSMDDIAAYMDSPEAPGLHPDVVYESATKLTGVDPFGAQQAKPLTVTGPSTVPGTSSQTSTQVRVHPGTAIEVGPGTSTDTQQATKTTTTTATHNVTYQGNKVTYNTTNITTTTITNNVTGDTVTNVETTETENDAPEEEPDDPPTDTPLGDIPKLYERKYPDGIVGIWNQKSQQIKQTPIFTFASAVMPTGLGGGSCPSWTLDLNLSQHMDMGSHQLEPPCWVWDVARGIVLVGALILARALVFGG